MSETIETLRLNGYKLIQCCCDHCGRTTMQPISGLPMWARRLTLVELAERMKCKRCGRRTRDVTPDDGRVPGNPWAKIPD